VGRCPTKLDACALVELHEDTRCLCTLDAIGEPVPGGSGDPGPPPVWIELPGFPEPDFGSWPFPPGGGSWPNLPPPGPGECDPMGFMNSCFSTAYVSCSTLVERGSPGTCELTIEPAEALEEVYVWTFNGSTVNASYGVNSTTWGGTLVQSGDVRVEFRAVGRDVTAGTKIEVVPRSGWEWSTADGITTAQGGMTWPASSASVGLVCRPGQTCPLGGGGWIVQPNSGFGHGTGYLRAPVSSGPNSGAWFVTAVTMNLHMVALRNPDYLSGGTSYPATGADAQACGESSSDTVMVGFTNYNEQCRGQSMTSFETWMWDHEGLHISNAIDNAASDSLQNIPGCVQRAAATHGHLATFAGIPTITWFWQQSAFESRPQGDTWWPESVCESL